jgi:histidine triad (HIT) family protein
MNDCIFCKIVSKEIPAHIVYEDEATLAMLDIRPSAPGHIMVIPKRHSASIQDYSAEELGTLMETVKKASIALEKALKCDAITIGINHKEKEGVFHLHVHLIPRYTDDGGCAIQGVVKKGGRESLGELAKNISNNLD